MFRYFNKRHQITPGAALQTVRGFYKLTSMRPTSCEYLKETFANISVLRIKINQDVLSQSEQNTGRVQSE